MLEHFYESSCHLRRLRQAPFSESINALASRLHELGYRRRYSQRIRWVVGKFNDYARAVGIETAEAVNESLMQRFVMEELTHQVIFAPIAMRHFWKHLRDQGIVPTVAAPHWDDPGEPVLRDYDEHLCNVRGLALTSRTESLRYAHRFLIWLQNRHGDKFIDRPQRCRCFGIHHGVCGTPPERILAQQPVQLHSCIPAILALAGKH